MGGRDDLGDVLADWRDAVAAAPVALAVYDGAGVVRLVNDALCQLLQRGPDEILGHRIMDLTHPEDREATIRRAFVAMDVQAPRVTHTKRFLTSSGAPVSVDVTVALRVGVDRQLDFALAVMTPAGERIPRSDLGPSGTWTFDLRAGVLRVDAGMAELIGVDPAVPIPQERSLDHVHPDDRQRVAEEAAEALLAGRAYSIRHRMMRADGQVSEALLIGELARDDSGTRVRGLLVDIGPTDDPQALPPKLSTLHWAVDASGIVQFKPSTATSLFAAIAAGAAAAESLHPDDCAALSDALARVVDGDGHAVVALRLAALGGGWRQTETTLRNRLDEEDVGAVTLESVDVSDRHIAARALDRRMRELEASEERFRLIFENAPTGMALFDPEGRYTAVNRAFAELVGRAPEEIIGSDVIDTVHPEQRADAAENRDRLLSGELTVLRTERQIIRGDGSARWVLVNTVLERDAEGQPAYFITMLQDISDRRAHERRLVEVASRDALTGLPNRSAARDALEAALVEAGERGHEVAVLFCDVDRFKAVNDRFGHPTGDAVLIEVARRLERSVRDGDVVARFAGDEFVVVCPDASPDHVPVIAGRIEAALAEPIAVAAGELRLSVSIGVARAGAGAAPDLLLADADEAMYEAKARGRARMQVFGEELHRRREDRVRIQTGIRDALDEGELLLHYQPQLDLHSGACLGVEALVRWEHPTRGQLDAVEFMTAAESGGIAGEISVAALDAACRQAAKWRCGTDDAVVPYIAVNLSASQLARADLVALVARSFRAAGAEPGGLRLELTETTLVEDLDMAGATLGALRDIGVVSGIDDFGTGYASLAYLHALPVAFLKLDGTFVQLLEGREGAVVTHIVGLAKDLGLEVIAECVETEAQRASLLARGVTAGQGYLWAPALSAEGLEEWLRTRE